MLKAVTKNGGVVQVNFFNGFDDQNFRNAIQAQSKDQAAAIQKYMDDLKSQGKPVNYVDVDRIEREWMAKIPRPPLKSLIDHIDHIAKVAGIDHVGVGSDFDGVSGATPKESIRPRICPRSHRPCSTGDTARRTSTRSWEATCCEFSAKWSASAA